MNENRWSGQEDARAAALDHADRRCDGNSRHCLRSAVHRYTLLPADGFGTALDDARPTVKQTCGFHRAQFAGSGRWVVLEHESLNRLHPDSERGRRRRAEDGR